MKLLFISLVEASMSRSDKLDTWNYRCYSHISERQFLDLTLFQIQKTTETDQRTTEASTLVQVRSSCSALGWLLCL